jgi:hypothetical protein
MPAGRGCDHEYDQGGPQGPAGATVTLAAAAARDRRAARLARRSS